MAVEVSRRISELCDQLKTVTDKKKYEEILREINRLLSTDGTPRLPRRPRTSRPPDSAA